MGVRWSREWVRGGGGCLGERWSELGGRGGAVRNGFGRGRRLGAMEDVRSGERSEEKWQ